MLQLERMVILKDLRVVIENCGRNAGDKTDREGRAELF
jgi:hypothetical protein